MIIFTVKSLLSIQGLLSMPLERALFPFGSENETPRALAIAVSPSDCLTLRQAKPGEFYASLTVGAGFNGGSQPVLQYRTVNLEKLNEIPNPEKLNPMDDWVVIKITDEQDLFGFARQINPKAWQAAFFAFVSPDFKKVKVGFAKQGNYYELESSALKFSNPCIPSPAKAAKSALFLGVGFLGRDVALMLARDFGFRDFTFVDMRKILRTGLELPPDNELFVEGTKVTDYAENAMRSLGYADLRVRSLQLSPVKVFSNKHELSAQTDLIVTTNSRPDAPLAAYLLQGSIFCPHLHIGTHEIEGGEESTTRTEAAFLLPSSPCPVCAGVFLSESDAACARAAMNVPTSSLRSMARLNSPIPVPSEGERLAATKFATEIYRRWIAGENPPEVVFSIGESGQSELKRVKQVPKCGFCGTQRVGNISIAARLYAK